MAQAFADAAPLLPHLQFGVLIEKPLTDELLGLVQQMGPRMRRLSVHSLALQSDQHANTPWPWDELGLGGVDLAHIARLPNPSGEGAPHMVTEVQVVLVSEDVLQVSGIHTCAHLSPARANPLSVCSV